MLAEYTRELQAQLDAVYAKTRALDDEFGPARRAAVKGRKAGGEKRDAVRRSYEPSGFGVVAGTAFPFWVSGPFPFAASYAFFRVVCLLCFFRS